MNSQPVVLCFSGLDPSGGAGIQADIEAILSQGCHPAAVVTALTVQDTCNVQDYACVDAQLVLRQARAVLQDMQVDAIKIGMLGSAAIAQVIREILREYPQIPVVLDPILAAGGGSNLSSTDLIHAINNQLLPVTYIATPNTIEAYRLAGFDNSGEPSRVIEKLTTTGVKHILLTGTHANTSDVQHHLYRGNTRLTSFDYPRLAGEYHGSGCTLAASLAACIAKKIDIIEASQQALDYTYNSLLHARAPGHGQLLPDRFYWTTK